MPVELGHRRRVHLHGLTAGALLVLALFLSVTLPSALAELARGEADPSDLGYLAGFAAFALGAWREARAWHRGDQPQAI